MHSHANCADRSLVAETIVDILMLLMLNGH